MKPRTRRCENCDRRVTVGFTHRRYDEPDRWFCKRVDWKKRAIKAERALVAIIEGQLFDAYETAAKALGIAEDATKEDANAIIISAARR